jgi:predicted Zn-dependent peptidase
MVQKELANFEKRVTVKVLPNGLTLILCDRPEAPVFSYFTMVNVGDANDPSGESGIAHMFEHLAFKGTNDIGTTDYPAEKLALAKVESAYAAYDAEFRKRVGRSPEKLKELKATFDAAEKAANQYVIPNEFTELAEANGASGVNAQTGLDATQYFWSMPSNRLQLWAYMESDRIANPVPRQFYRERSVVMEERRMRINSNPIGLLEEQFLAAAYIAHPYGRPGVGWMSELSQITATEAAAFHKKYYVPSNIVIAVVGDVSPANLSMLEKYFGAIPAGPRPEAMTTVEPQQVAEKSVILKMPTQPLFLEGYHKPDYRDPDNAVYDAIQDIFSNGRTSRLYRSLVEKQQVAADAEGFTDFPGDKYPNLFAFFAAPNAGHTPQQMRAAIDQQIEKLKTTDVTDAELENFKTRARADLLRGLADNQGIAEQLAYYQQRYGDWRQLFKQLNQIDAVTKADIRRVANKIFVPGNCTYALVEYQAPPNPPGQQPEPQPQAAAKGGAR